MRPDSIDSNKTLILSKEGISGMNVMRIEKGEGNSSIQVYLSLDGINESLIISSPEGVIANDEWVNLVLTYDDSNGTISLFADSSFVSQTSGHYFTGTSLSSRFTSLILGGGTTPIEATFDDLRIYNDCLSSSDIENLYGNGGGDFNRVELIGAGQTRIIANQKGSSEYEKALPVSNYLTVVRVPQSIEFASILDHSVGDFPFKLEANSSSGLPVSFISSDPSLATVVGEYVYPNGAGEVTITATQAGDRKYEPAEEKIPVIPDKLG